MKYAIDVVSHEGWEAFYLNGKLIDYTDCPNVEELLGKILGESMEHVTHEPDESNLDMYFDEDMQPFKTLKA